MNKKLMEANGLTEEDIRGVDRFTIIEQKIDTLISLVTSADKNEKQSEENE